MQQTFVGMFEGRPRLQRIVRFGLLGKIRLKNLTLHICCTHLNGFVKSLSLILFSLGMDYDDELDDTGEDDYEGDSWPHGYSNFHGYPRLSDLSSDRGFRGNHTRASSSIYQPPLHYFTSADLPHPPSVKVQPKENVSSLLLRF